MSDRHRLDQRLANIAALTAPQRPLAKPPDHRCRVCGVPAPVHVSSSGREEGFYCRRHVPEI